MGDDLFEASPVGDPAPVELGLAFAQPAAHGLAGDGSAPLVVGAVALWRVALAAAARFPARGVAEHDAARADESDGGKLGREGAVGALMTLELAGHDTSIRRRQIPDPESVSIYADRYRDRRQGGPR